MGRDMACATQPNPDVAVTAAVNGNLMGLMPVPGAVAPRHEIGLVGPEGSWPSVAKLQVDSESGLGRPYIKVSGSY